MPLRVHIKVNTGMGSIGVLPADLPALLDDVRRAGCFQIDGIYSHFASADPEYSGYQLRVFRQITESQNRLFIGSSFRWNRNSCD